MVEGMADLAAARTTLEQLRARLEQAPMSGRGGYVASPMQEREVILAERPDSGLAEEREAILAQARGQAAAIVRAAETECERLLGEIRAAERRLCAAQTQLQQLLNDGQTEPVQAGTAAAPAEILTFPTKPRPDRAEEVYQPTDPNGRRLTAHPPAAAAPGVRVEPHEIQLLFNDVPGHQHAAPLEQAVRSLPGVDRVQILEFERRRLVLRLRLADPELLPELVMGRAPFEVRLVERSREQVAFQLVLEAAPARKLDDWWVWSAYLAAIVVAEVLIVLWSPQFGMGLHLALLFTILVHASLGPSEWRPLLVALVFAPLVRVVSLALPLAGLPTVYWYLLTSLPLFIAAALAIRILGLSRDQLALRIGNLRLQLAIGLIGFPLGAIEYFILAPTPLIHELSWQVALVPILILLISTGFIEELVFRGVLQATARKVLGPRGLIYVSAVFAALHIGYLSAPDVAFVFSVGLAFAWLVMRTGSLLGVTLAHGLTNIALYLVLPLVAFQVPAR
jgi:membrane protease YdiL (CAAX protease family)